MLEKFVNVTYFIISHQGKHHNTHLDGIKEKITQHMNSSRAGGSSARVVSFSGGGPGDPRED